MRSGMDRKTLELLEFEKIQEMLAGQASTPLGRARALESYPLVLPEARAAQSVGKELLDVLGLSAAPDISGAHDVRTKVKGAAQGIVLAAEDLWEVSRTVGAFGTLKTWLSKVRGEYAELERISALLPDMAHLAARLDEIAGEKGEIKDTASPKLAQIRRSYRGLQERLRKRAEEMVRQPGIAQYLQDPLVTLRNGRYVLPVKQESAGRVQGLVHDHSASGQTLFIEPVELLEMGNNLKRLELAERDEMERILAEISQQIGMEASSIIDGMNALSEFDLGLAKARLAAAWNGAFPSLVAGHSLSFVRAWHPLLKGNPVPMDLSLDERGVRTVVITGPNMGGKTVALKTCGLLTAMALSGFPCPCHEETEVGDIREVLCDIGDEQSIEANLSTFSAHMSNVIRILEEAEPGKLVLMDELAAGTDPREGAALALALLRKLNQSGAISVVTTHYSEVKAMAQGIEGMENASVEWDAVNMRPTYRLISGRPGRSYAFDVAKKLGLHEDIISEAKENMQEEVLRLDELIHEMEVSAQKHREESWRAQSERERLASLRQEYESRLSELERTRKETLNRARHEAMAIVQRARLDFEEAVKEFRQRQKEAVNLQVEAPALRERLRGALDEFAPEETREVDGFPIEPAQAVPGARVTVAGLLEEGTVLERPEPDGSVLVRVGSVSLRTSLDRLSVPVRRKPEAHLRDSAAGDDWVRDARNRISMQKAESISPEVDLRGMTRDEAFLALDKYMDDALLASMKEIRIIHGKGTGALRSAVAEYLRKNPVVAGFRLGEQAEGGAGVTVARLA